MAEKAINTELKRELERLAKSKDWDVAIWRPMDNAIVLARAICATIAPELLDDAPKAGEAPEVAKVRAEANRKERTALCELMLPILNAGAAINTRRGLLVELGYAPAMAEKAKASEANAMV